MITIIADPGHLRMRPENALPADTADDYVVVRQRIRHSLNQSLDLTVYVTSTVLLHALEDLRRYRGRVQWEEVDLAAIFERAFGIPPSPPFTTDVLASLDIDQLPHPSAPVDPLSWILHHRLDPLWGHPTPPAGHERAILPWAIHYTELPAALIPLLVAQLQRWGSELPIYKALRPLHIQADVRALLCRAALQRYDSSWIDQQPWGNLPLVSLDGLENTATEAMQTIALEIAAYWKRRYADSGRVGDMIDLALIQMSGLSAVELDALIDMIGDHPARLDASLYDRITQRFYQAGFAPSLDPIRRLIAPPEPDLPDLSWDDRSWLRWATETYLPYYAWVLRSGVAREHQRACALQFSDWLYRRYKAWLNTDESPIILRQFRELRELVDNEPDSVVLWLIVDGLTWWQGELLLNVCRSRGLYPQSYEPGIAALPSITSISKRALITGVTTSDLEPRSVAEVGRQHFVQSGIPAHVSYRFSEIRRTLEENDGVRCLVILYNMIDVLAHKLTEFSDGGAIRGCLEELGSELNHIRTVCERAGRRLHVMIGSDHGSTLLPPDAAPQTLPSTTREIEDIWEPTSADRELPRPSSRAAVIVDPSRMTAEERERWYVLERERFQLDRHYLIPRGDGYIGRRPEGWTHGGLSPEEVIVPLIRLAAELPQLLPVDVRISGMLRARQEGSLNVTILNPNRLPLGNVRLDVVGVGALTTDVLADSDTFKAILRVAAPITSASELPLHWQLSYRVMGEVHRQEGSHNVPIRRLSVDDSGFDDLFGDET